METLERRTERLQGLAKACGIALKIAAGITIVLPVVTLGTDINKHAITFSTYFGVGVFLGPAYAKWINLVERRLNKTGRSVGSPWFLIGLFGGILPVGSFVYYLVLRLFAHDGDWVHTFAFSWETLRLSILLNGLLACMAGLLKMALVHYRDGENIIFKDGKPSRFWHVVAFFMLALVAPVLMIIASYLVGPLS